MGSPSSRQTCTQSTSQVQEKHGFLYTASSVPSLSTQARMRAARLCLCMLCAKLWVGTAESQTVCAHTSKLLSRKEAADAGNGSSHWGHHSATYCRHRLFLITPALPHNAVSLSFPQMKALQHRRWAHSNTTRVLHRYQWVLNNASASKSEQAATPTCLVLVGTGKSNTTRRTGTHDTLSLHRKIRGNGSLAG